MAADVARRAAESLLSNAAVRNQYGAFKLPALQVRQLLVEYRRIQGMLDARDRMGRHCAALGMAAPGRRWAIAGQVAWLLGAQLPAQPVGCAHTSMQGAS